MCTGAPAALASSATRAVPSTLIAWYVSGG